MKNNTKILVSVIDRIENEMFQKFKTYKKISLHEDVFYNYSEKYYEQHFIRVTNQLVNNI